MKRPAVPALMPRLSSNPRYNGNIALSDTGAGGVWWWCCARARVCGGGGPHDGRLFLLGTTAAPALFASTSDLRRRAHTPNALTVRLLEVGRRAHLRGARAARGIGEYGAVREEVDVGELALDLERLLGWVGVGPR